MALPLLEELAPADALAERFFPEPLPDGTQPEKRIVLCGVSWERHLEMDRALGDNRPGPRFYYLDGELEIMSTSEEHERIKKWIGDFLADYFLAQNFEVMPRGQATMRSALKLAGAEPDDSWCLSQEKEFPDLVLEIALTSGGVSKLETYRRFEVPEVWIWRRGQLEIYLLRMDASGYDLARASRLLPDLDLGLLTRCVAIRSWREARQAFRAGLKIG